MSKEDKFLYCAELYEKLFPNINPLALLKVLHTPKEYLFNKTPYEVCITEDNAQPLIDWLEERLGIQND